MVALAMTWGASAAEVGFTRATAGKAVVSLPERWAAMGPEVPVWIHLHGATEVVEREFGAVGAPGVLVTLTLPGLSRVYAEHFARAGAWTELLGEVERVMRERAAGKNVKAGRVTVSSFSAGFGGVRELLKQPEAYGRIGTLVMADSIYCGYAGDPTEKQVDAELMKGFVAFAKDAAEGRKRMVVSHSGQVPEGYASTTETADFLIAAVNGERSEEREEWEGGLRLVSEAARGQFAVLGFAGAGPEDHMAHLRGLRGFFGRVAPAVGRGAVTLDELRAQLSAHVGQPRFRGAAWGVKVVSLETGGVLFEHEPARLLSPASNAKLYVGALALDRLGGDYRIVTPILATAKPDAAGVLRGDVVVSGRGDPSWNSGTARKKFEEIFEPFVATIAAAGVKRVIGDVVADATFLRGTPHGSGWTADDLNDYYGAEISAVTLEDNYVDLRVTPGAGVGDAARVELVQPHTGLVLDNRVTTSAKGSPRRVQVTRLIGEKVVHVFGQIPAGAAAYTTEATVPRPAQWFATALKAALEKRGISVEGKARSVRWPEPSVSEGSGVVKLGEVMSPQMHELVAAFMKPSQNLQTDLIFGYVGEKEREGPSGDPLAGARSYGAGIERSSEALAVGALRDFLRQNRLEADDVRFDEGSGLSRNNLTSARATVALLTFMAQHREAEAFQRSLPVAGVEGTLRRRFKGTPAEGNLRAKTGTLRWANSLSGYVTTARGERLAFAVMLNRAVAPAGRSVREEVDAVGEMLARFEGRSGSPANDANQRE